VSLADLQDATFNSGKVEFVLDAKVDQIRGRYSRPCSSLVGELLTISSSWGPSVSPISGKRGIRASLNWRSSVHRKKMLVEAAPKVIKSAVPKNEAEALVDRLKQFGSTLALK